MFDNLKKKAQELAGQHGDKIEKGLDKAGKVAKDRFGHNEKVDNALNKAKGFLDENRAPDQQPDQPGQQPDQQEPGQQTPPPGPQAQSGPPPRPEDPQGGTPGPRP